MMQWCKAKFAELREHAKGWKTVILGALVGAPLAVLQILEAFSVVDHATILPPPWGQRLALGVSVAMILLRLITTGPVGSKGNVEVTNAKAGD